MESEGEVVLHAEAEEDVLQCRAPRFVRLGEGNLEIVSIQAIVATFPYYLVYHQLPEYTGDKMSSSHFIFLLILSFFGPTMGQEQLLMVFGGDPCFFSNKVTLLSLDGGPPVPECLQDISPHPRRLTMACTASLGEGKLLLVNILFKFTFHRNFIKQTGCLLSAVEIIMKTLVVLLLMLSMNSVINMNQVLKTYSPPMKNALNFHSLDLDTWTETGNLSLPYGGYFTAACTANSVPEMIMSGGILNGSDNSDLHISNDTSYTKDGISFELLPEMPLALRSHCIVALDGDDLFVTGGSTGDYYSTNNQSFLYHSDTKVWERLPDLPTARSNLMCAMVHNEEGDQEVVTVGGYTYSEPFYEGNVNVTEIYNLKTGEWRTG